jgi:hypothetical protein
VSKAYLPTQQKASLFASRKETDRGAGKSIFFPKSILQVSEIGGGHVFGMADKEHKYRRLGSYLGDEGRSSGFGRLSFSHRERMIGQNGLKKLIQRARRNPFVKRSDNLIDQGEKTP